MHTITEDLLKELKAAPDIETFFQKHQSRFIEKSPVTYLNELIAVKDLRVADVAKASGRGEYVYKVFKGERLPSRDVLISIAFGMRLSLEEAQLLLRISKFAILDAREKRDSILIYCLTHGCDVFQTDDMLDAQDATTLQ